MNFRTAPNVNIDTDITEAKIMNWPFRFIFAMRGLETKMDMLCHMNQKDAAQCFLKSITGQK